MSATTETMPEARPADSDREPVPCAVIDLDRFCDGCGYNLRTLPVRRDERLGIPLVRCPECGRYQPANDGATVLRPWLNRATTLMLGFWILLIVAAFFNLGLAEGALSYATLDELTSYGGYTTRLVGGNVIKTWSGGLGPLEVKTDYEHYRSVTYHPQSGWLEEAPPRGACTLGRPRWGRVNGYSNSKRLWF